MGGEHNVGPSTRLLIVASLYTVRLVWLTEQSEKWAQLRTGEISILQGRM